MWGYFDDLVLLWLCSVLIIVQYVLLIKKEKMYWVNNSCEFWFENCQYIPFKQS